MNSTANLVLQYTLSSSRHALSHRMVTVGDRHYLHTAHIIYSQSYQVPQLFVTIAADGMLRA